MSKLDHFKLLRLFHNNSTQRNYANYKRLSLLLNITPYCKTTFYIDMMLIGYEVDLQQHEIDEFKEILSEAVMYDDDLIAVRNQYGTTTFSVKFE